ncbi:hypothetical protein [Halorientalis halophila]|uniref:hypothetical protein n=1 Tax=Halorientalis halophila TaxID=3108499 RepID=UPI00300B89C8
MTTKTDDSASSATDDFESALQTLVLESFAAGETVAGTWTVTSSSSVVPSWRVTIEKTDEATLSRDSTVFLDE